MYYIYIHVLVTYTVYTSFIHDWFVVDQDCVQPYLGGTWTVPRQQQCGTVATADGTSVYFSLTHILYLSVHVYICLALFIMYIHAIKYVETNSVTLYTAVSGLWYYSTRVPTMYMYM